MKPSKFLLVLVALTALVFSFVTSAQETAEDLYQQGLDALKHYRHEEAGAFFAQALELDPDYVYGYIGQARYLFRTDQDAEALAVINQAIELAPNTVEAYWWRARILSFLDGHDEAMADLDFAESLSPNDPMIVLSRGYVLWSEDPEQALEFYNQAVALESDIAFLYDEAGGFYSSQGMYEEAEASFTRAIELDPELGRAYDGRGWIRAFVFNDYESGLADFSMAIELLQDYDHMYLNRGNVYGLLENDEAAVADLSTYLELIPDDDWALYLRAYSYYVLQQYDDALSDISNAITLYPDGIDYYVLMGDIQVAMGAPQDALKSYCTYIELGQDYEYFMSEYLEITDTLATELEITCKEALAGS